jgi:hypothetical protein
VSSRSDRYETSFFEVTEVKVETDLALLCVFEDGREEWIAKSLIREGESEVLKKGDVGEIAIPVWLAEEKGLL